MTELPDAATCAAFVNDAANVACLTCALSRSTATTYGPIIDGSVELTINEAGCIALATGDVTAAGCGPQVSAEAQCARRACDQSCPVFTDDAASLASLVRCEKLAGATGCKTYAEAASCALALEGDAGAAAICTQSAPTLRENAKAMVTLFCGGIAGDSGASDAGEGG